MSVIFAVIGGAIMLYCLYSKRTKTQAILAGLMIGIIFTFVSRGPEDFKNPDKFSKEYKIVLAIQGISLAEMGEKISMQTPLEKGGDALIVVLAFVAIFAIGVLGDEKDIDESAKLILKKCFALFAVTSMYFLSLYAGITIPIVSWIKDKKLSTKSG